MGTRSLTYVYDNNETPIVCLYRQFDGYPTGHGADLANFLNDGKLVNGLPFGEDETHYFNGMGCLAAQLIANFKDGPGGFYLYPTNDLSQDVWQEWEYHVYENRVTVYEGTWSEGHVVFNGTWKKFVAYCEGDQDEVQDGPTVSPFVDDKFSRDWLKQLLHESEVEVTFTKKDGTQRVMKCTLDADVVPETGTSKTVNRNDEALPVYDVEAKGWRSFRWDSVKTVAFGV